MDRLLMWGGLRPFWFAVNLVLVATLLAAPAIPASKEEWVLLILPDLPKEYTHAGFFGTVWSVQATLVALVYPIVLTFVPILLQRRASSRYALAVYMHDSGVVPAGTSSMLLLAVMTLEYLASPYIDATFFLFAAVSNGLWFVANIALTTRFLVRTIKYVRGEFGEAAFRRLAIHIALRRDLMTALCEHMVEKRSHQVGSFSFFTGEPLVKFARLRNGDVDAVKTFSGTRRLTDVNIAALNWVVRRWLERIPAPAPMNASPKKRDERPQPALEILPTVGDAYVGSADLVRTTKGPGLTHLEIAVLRRAFIFEKSGLTVIDGTTLELLEELAAEVQSQFEDGHFATATAEFDKLQDLHIAFVLGASATTNDDDLIPLFQLRAPWSWIGRPLGNSWMDVYRALIRSSVQRLDVDQTIWERLAAVPPRLVQRAEVSKPHAARELLQHFILMDHFLSSWWRRRLQQGRTEVGDEGAWLPQPEREDYQQAVVALVGAISSFGIASRDQRSEPELLTWDDRCELAGVLLHQLDLSCMLMIGAVARGDASAARWHCDNVLHWLSSHSYEFEKGLPRLYFVPPQAIAVDVLKLSAAEADAKLALVGSEHGRHAQPEAYVWHAMQRHWEAIRLVCGALALHLGEAEGVPVLGAVVAAALCSLKFFQEGLDEVEARFSNLDDILLRYVDLCCIDKPTRGRMHGFVDRVQRGREMNIAVPNWTYSGTRMVSNPEAFAANISTMLLAIDSSGEPHFQQTLKRIGELDDIDALREVLQLLDGVLEAFQPQQLGRTVRYAGVLRRHLNPSRDDALRPFRMRVALGELTEYAAERIRQKLAGLQVAREEVALYVQRLSNEVLRGERLPGWGASDGVRFGVVSDDVRCLGLSLHHDKESFTSPPKSPLYASHIEQAGKHILGEARRIAFADLIERSSIQPLTESDDSALLQVISERCDELILSGSRPLVFAPMSSRSHILFSYRWGWGSHPALPDGVQLGQDELRADGHTGQSINGHPVIRLDTPDNHFYVLPQSAVAELVFEETSEACVLDFEYEVDQPSRLGVRVTWRAQFQEIASADVQ